MYINCIISIINQHTHHHDVNKGPDPAGHLYFYDFRAEPGMPCKHRGLFFYFPDDWTLKKLHAYYVEKMRERHGDAFKTVAYTQFTAMLKKFYPNVKLARRTEDECDACFRIRNLLKNAELSDEQRADLQGQLDEHLDAGRGQRRVVTEVARALRDKHVKSGNPADSSAALITLDRLVGDDIDEQVQSGAPTYFSLACEDYGGGFALPWYGKKRPGSDYFLSNWTVNQFYISDMVQGLNHVFMYDETPAGKGADAVCSMRMYHFIQDQKNRKAQGIDGKNQVRMSVRDRCVGQNNSQATSKFQMASALIFGFFQIVLYMVSGHSHNQCDIAVAHARKMLRNKNLFSLQELVDAMDKMPSLLPQNLTPRDGFQPFRSGWLEVLDKYITTPMPPGYTQYHYQEYNPVDGTVKLKMLASSSDAEAITFTMVADPKACREALMLELFGSTRLDEVTLENLRLPRTPKKVLTEKKIKSLREKMPGIPPKYWQHYPESAKATGTAEERLSNELSAAIGHATPGVSSKRPVGRPSKKRKMDPTSQRAAGQRSLLAMWSVARSASGNPGLPAASTVAVAVAPVVAPVPATAAAAAPVQGGGAATPPSVVDTRWATAFDPKHKRTYWYHKITKETSWTKRT